MQIPTKRLSDGSDIPVLGLGTWRIGGDKKYNPANDDEADIAWIRTALEMGVTHIDTAENYAEGHCELIVGRAIVDLDRSDLYLVSKVDKTNLAYDDVLRSAEASLKRLGTDYLDLYLVHSPNLSIPLEETLGAMNRLKEQGLVRSIGVSNFCVDLLRQAQQYAESPIVANQLHYNLVVREIEHKDILTYCQEHGIMVVAWRSLDYGNLAQTGQVELLDELSNKYSKTSAQIALNWLISQNNVVAITRMSSVEYISENLGAVGWRLEDEDIDRLRSEFPGKLDVSPVSAIVQIPV